MQEWPLPRLEFLLGWQDRAILSVFSTKIVTNNQIYNLIIFKMNLWPNKIYFYAKGRSSGSVENCQSSEWRPWLMILCPAVSVHGWLISHSLCSALTYSISERQAVTHPAPCPATATPPAGRSRTCPPTWRSQGHLRQTTAVCLGSRHKNSDIYRFVAMAAKYIQFWKQSLNLNFSFYKELSRLM